MKSSAQRHLQCRLAEGQDRAQNFIHSSFKPGSQHFYNNYSQMYEG